MGQVMGPSCDVNPPAYYSISGIVYFDVNLNGVLDYTELGLRHVSVYLYDSADNFVMSYYTAEDGVYMFPDLAPGDYRVDVPPVTIEEDFNEFLYSLFIPTTSTYFFITLVAEDSLDNNFGYGYSKY